MKKLYAITAFLLVCAGAFCQPAVPSSFVFAGETIDLSTVQRHERMDRELLAFTYTHQTSILMIKRSQRYFAMITPILKKNGIPEDLKYLCVIESNLDPGAVSTAGAAGLWQFTKGTAQNYGLEVNASVDERYNIEKETEAACRYFLKAYEKYGNWMTVAASYNAGMAGISSRLEAQKQTNALELWMTVETTRYLYRLMAAKMMLENPSAFGFQVRERYPLMKVEKTVTLSESNVDLVEFAAGYGLSYAELRRANMWLLGTVLPNTGKKNYKIIIPAAGQ